jgi:hypothetical protein
MGRFFKTNKGNFVDFAYEAPIQLAQQALGVHEARTDELVKKAEVLEGVADQIQHLNFDAENQRVKGIQDKYGNAIEGITNKILEDPLSYSKHMPAIKALQKEMVKDKTSGEWYQVEKRLQDYQSWVSDNKELKESNPNLYNRLNAHYYNDLVDRATGNPDATFQGQQIIDRPDLIKSYRQVFENIKADSTLQSDGRYLYKDKYLTEDEVANIAWNTLRSDENYLGYVNQMGNVLGDTGYLDENGNPAMPFNLVDGSGNVISAEQYDKLSDEDKRKVTRQLDPNNPFYGDLAATAQTYGFRERTAKVDPYGLATHKGRIQSSQIAQRGNQALQLEQLRQAGRKDLMDEKYKHMAERDRIAFKNQLALKAAEGDKDAENTEKEIIAKETLGVLGNPIITMAEDLEQIKNVREASDIEFPDNRTYVKPVPGTAAYSALQRWSQSTEAGIKSHGATIIELPNGSSFPAKQYFEWLGKREHNEANAREFLETKGNYVNTDSGRGQSLAQASANDWRWTPDWAKSDAAVVWDKLYEVGNAFEESRANWYESYSNEQSEVSLQPINDKQTNNQMVQELKSNAQNYYMVNASGEIMSNYRDKIKGLEEGTQLRVTPANAHNQMGIETTIDGESYYIFPNDKHTAAENVMVNLSLKNMDTDSQYYTEMSNRIANNISQDILATGKNSKGTKSIITKIDGKLLSLELVGEKVLVRDPDAGLNTEPQAEFNNMRTFVKTMYAPE